MVKICLSRICIVDGDTLSQIPLEWNISNKDAIDILQILQDIVHTNFESAIQNLSAFIMHETTNIGPLNSFFKIAEYYSGIFKDTFVDTTMPDYCKTFPASDFIKLKNALIQLTFGTTTTTTTIAEEDVVVVEEEKTSPPPTTTTDVATKNKKKNKHQLYALEKQISELFMAILETEYLSFSYHLLLSATLLGLYFTRNDNVVVKVDPQIGYPSEFTNPFNIIINFVFKKSLVYLDESKIFLAYLKKHFNIGDGKITQVKEALIKKNNYKKNISETMVLKNMLFRKLLTKFKDNLQQTFSNVMPYKLSANHTIKMSDDAIHNIIDIMLVNNTNQNNQNFIQHTFPEIVAWFGFECKDPHLALTFNSLYFFPYVLCLNTPYRDLFCVERSHFLKRLSGNKTVKTEQLKDNIKHMIDTLNDLKFITLSDLSQIMKQQDTQIFVVVESLIQKFEEQYKDDQTSAISKVLNKFKAWFMSSASDVLINNVNEE